MSFTLLTLMTNFQSLPQDVQDIFYNAASKFENMNAEQVFEHLVPEALQESAWHVRTFMDGGTVTKEVWVHDRGMANGHYDTVEFELPDRDISRIQSGANGGEYTADNTIMEEASVNRSYGAEDMTEARHANAVESNESAVDIISDGFDSATEAVSSTASEVFKAGPAPDLGEVIIETPPAPVEAGGELLGELGGAVLDGIVPAVAGYKAATYVADQFDEDIDKVGYGSLAAGGTVFMFANPVTGPFLCTGALLYSGWKVTEAVVNAVNRSEPTPATATAGSSAGTTNSAWATFYKERADVYAREGNAERAAEADMLAQKFSKKAEDEAKANDAAADRGMAAYYKSRAEEHTARGNYDAAWKAREHEAYYTKRAEEKES